MVSVPLIPPESIPAPWILPPAPREHWDPVAPAGCSHQPSSCSCSNTWSELQSPPGRIFPKDSSGKSCQALQCPGAGSRRAPGWSCSPNPTDGQKSNPIQGKALGGGGLVGKGLFLNQHMGSCDSTPTFQGRNTPGVFTGCSLLLEVKARIPFICMDLTQSSSHWLVTVEQKPRNLFYILLLK